MSPLILLLRWLFILAIAAVGLHYAWKFSADDAPVAYRTVPLVQGSKSVGLQLAGVAVDPTRRAVYAVVGGEKKPTTPGDFFILLGGNDGERCGLRFFDHNKGTMARYELRRQGQLLCLNEAGREVPGDGAVADNGANANTQAAVQSIVQALPQDFDLFGKR